MRRASLSESAELLVISAKEVNYLPLPSGPEMVLRAWNVVKGCDLEMISMTFNDHNLGGQPGQLATAKPQGGSKQCSTCAKMRFGANAAP